jgi:hypothetical protein
MGIKHSSQYAEVPGLMYARVPPKAIATIAIENGWRLPIRMPRMSH